MEYFEQVYANKFKNLCEVDKLIERHNYQSLFQMK